MDAALFNRLIAAMVARGPNEPPPGTDPEQRGTWQSQPAPDGRFVGIRPRQEPSTSLPPTGPRDEKQPDRDPWMMYLPPGSDMGERAYHPTLQYENTIPAHIEQQRAVEAARRAGRYPEQIQAANEFQRSKSLAEVGIAPTTMDEILARPQRNLERAGDRLRRVLPAWMGGR